MPATHQEIREKLSPLFCDDSLRLVVLFGSAATGKTHGRSDVDLAFLYSRPVDILALTNDVIRLLRTDDVDVVDLGRASPLLKFAAVSGGTPLFEHRAGEFIQFYTLAFRMFVDTEKLRDARAASVRRFLEERGLS
jgi:predicted nucleotidyltransferase